MVQLEVVGINRIYRNITEIVEPCSTIVVLNQIFAFLSNSPFFGPANPNRYAPILRIWISSAPSVMR